MIKPEFGLFQVQQEGVFGHALELLEAGFVKAPKGLDAVDVRGPESIKKCMAVAGTKLINPAGGNPADDRSSPLPHTF